MCGICGIFNFDPEARIEEQLLRRMADLLVHRGPDEEGYFTAGPVGFGHRRLSIIDISTGQQPMSNEDGSVWISYNGEIYNFMDLRADLEAAGHVFRTRSDTEVIVHLYEERGLEALEALNGIFAFALWDGRERRLILARDRFGVKPLYYTVQPGARLIFASEVKAILVAPGVRCAVDPFGLAEHFTFQNTFGDRTLFRDIRILPAGHFLIARARGVEEREYWDITYREGEDLGEAAYEEGLRERFESAVQRQLVGEVPVGSYLSGGMDSGSITAVAARHIRPFHTFTCGFDTSQVSEEEKLFDERVEAEQLARVLDTRHFERHLFSGDMVRVLPRVVRHLEDFRVGISYQVYYISELISRYVTVVLSGVGGDEFFAGYPWRYEPVLALRDREEFAEAYYRLWIRFLNDEEKKRLFTDRLNSELGGFSTFESFRAVLDRDRSDEPLNRAMYFDARTFLDGLFIVEDKLSMAHSIETRVPFLDNDFIDFTLAIPPAYKLRDGEIKYILKRAMRKLLPAETLTRRKQGFTPPDKSWYQSETLSYIRGLLLSKRAGERDFFRPEGVEAILEAHCSGQKNHRFLIWSLICFELWNRIFIEDESMEALEEEGRRYLRDQG